MKTTTKKGKQETTAVATAQDNRGLQIFQGLVQAGADIPEDEMLSEEELDEEYDGIGTRQPLLQFNGQSGDYHYSTEEDEKFETASGIILGRLDDGQTYWSEEKERERGVPDWICRSESTQGHPRVHPDLLANQRAVSYFRGQGVGGFTGQGCQGCPLGRWNGKTPPRCANRLRLLWLDERFQKLFILEVSGTSIGSAKAFLAKFKDKRDNPARYITHLNSAQREKGSRKWHEMTFSVDTLMEDEARKLALEYKRQEFNRIRQELREFRGDDIPQEAIVQAAAPTPTQAPQQQPAARPNGQTQRQAARDDFAPVGAPDDDQIPFDTGEVVEDDPFARLAGEADDFLNANGPCPF